MKFIGKCNSLITNEEGYIENIHRDINNQIKGFLIFFSKNKFDYFYHNFNEVSDIQYFKETIQV